MKLVQPSARCAARDAKQFGNPCSIDWPGLSENGVNHVPKSAGVSLTTTIHAAVIGNCQVAFIKLVDRFIQAGENPLRSTDHDQVLSLEWAVAEGSGQHADCADGELVVHPAHVGEVDEEGAATIDVE